MSDEHRDLTARAREWFAARRGRLDRAPSLDVSVFHDLAPEDEQRLLDDLRAWHQQRWDARLAGLDWPSELGGHDAGQEAQAIVDEIATGYEQPPAHELFSVTTRLIAPTVRLLGSDEQRQEYARAFARAERLCCQLFSEPGAGSDLAGLSTRARLSDGTWTIDGQKVWSSGAQFADMGLLIARTDENAVKHAGMTAFLMPMQTQGVTVRPLRQMSGGSSFCEVFLEGVRIPDRDRVGEVGDGWKVALTTLSFERETSGGDTDIGGSWDDVLDLARRTGAIADPRLRSRIADVLIHHRLAQIASLRDRAARQEGRPQGPEGSLRKLQWTNGLTLVSDVVAAVLGPALLADTGVPGSYDWTSHLLGAPGYRIAGGTDEIQRSIIAERMLELPATPKADRGRPWKEIPR